MTKQRRFSIILMINIMQLRGMSWRVLRCFKRASGKAGIRNPESGIGTGIGTGTGSGTGIGTGMGRETYTKAGTTFTLI